MARPCTKVRVDAGVLVSDLLDYLQLKGLTLPTFPWW
jgi:FAD/FMN-containing dehydrogenase